MNVQQINATQPPDWTPSPAVLARLRAAVNREAYPPRPRPAAVRPGR